MRKYIFSVLIALLSLPVIAQQQQSQAKVVLEKTAEAFKKAGGVRADFTLKAVNDGHLEGRENGIIQLKGEKFMLKKTYSYNPVPDDADELVKKHIIGMQGNLWRESMNTSDAGCQQKLEEFLRTHGYGI